MGAKNASVADREIGERIKAIRLTRRVSQSSLADHLGITFQQIQKYEKGSNRVSASRLLQVANFLDVDLSMLATGETVPGSFDWQFAARNRTTAELAHLWDRLPEAVQDAMLILARATAGGPAKE